MNAQFSSEAVTILIFFAALFIRTQILSCRWVPGQNIKPVSMPQTDKVLEPWESFHPIPGVDQGKQEYGVFDQDDKVKRDL
ncbi:hypothetical protein Trydic_g1504 [Trypoxylus dichotomus]